MSQAFTARNFQIAEAPKRIELLGDKTRRPEPAQHIIEFPGGAIEVSRTTDGLYWAHIIVETENWGRTPGRVVASRLGQTGKSEAVVDLAADLDAIVQIAVLIESRGGGRS